MTIPRINARYAGGIAAIAIACACAGRPPAALSPVTTTGPAAAAVPARPNPCPDHPVGTGVDPNQRIAPPSPPPPFYYDCEVDIGAQLAPGNSPPTLPAQLRGGNRRGNTTVRFLIDTTGRAVPTTITIVSSTSDVFARAVVQHVPEMHFVPARVNGQKVVSQVDMPFMFTNTP